MTGPRWTSAAVDGRSGVLLELHVDDVGRAIVHATEAGAVLLDRGEHAVLRSPAGVTFHLVATTPDEPRATAAVAARISVPSRSANAELSFWDRVKPSEIRGLDLVVERDPDATEARVELV